jgi:DNA uptake protein ComE-like DNA-binding protein
MSRFRTKPTQLLLSVVFAAVGCTAAQETPSDTTAAVADTGATATTADTSSAMTTPTPANVPTATNTTATDTTKIKRININTATDAEILAIPGMGPRMLREFKEYRPYTSIEQFRREIGKYVDKKEVARFEQYIEIK